MRRSLRAIARHLGRSASTVSREISRNLFGAGNRQMLTQQIEQRGARRAAVLWKKSTHKLLKLGREG
jgi:IS30 family transposase